MTEEQIYDISKMASSIDEVPDVWIYKNYYSILTWEKLNLDRSFQTYINQPFDGRTIKMRSIKNRDTDPSLCFYFKNGKYLWYDYSEQKGGDAVYFLAYHIDMTRAETSAIIMRDYELWLKDGGDDSEFEQQAVYVKPKFSCTIDPLGKADIDFWNQYKITYDILNKYQVKKLRNYSIIRGEKSTTFSPFCYGYFSADYGLYQIYCPRTNNAEKQVKYLTINKDYLIGSDQLTGQYNVCAIVSGLKDLMAIKSLGLKMDFVANSSESYMLSKDKIEFLKVRYPNVISILDNDKTGINTMRLYEKVHKIPFARIDLDKDLAMNNEMRKLDELIRVYTHAINKITNKWVSP